jgi:hypothetical protein
MFLPMSDQSPSTNVPVEFPITDADRERIAQLNGKPVRFTISGVAVTGTLLISSSESKARAAIHVNRDAGYPKFAVGVINLTADQFRGIQETPEGVLLPAQQG